MLLACGQSGKEAALRSFIDEHANKIKPLQKEAALAYWQAACTGDTAQYSRFAELNLKIRNMYTDHVAYEFLQEIKKSGAVHDPLLDRQLDLLLNAYKENQIDAELLKKMVDLAARVEQKFSTFRGRIAGAIVTNNQIDEILKKELNSSKRRTAWEASKQVGPEVAADLVQLVGLRNQAAKRLGFDNYHQMSLQLAEQSEEEVETIFNELYTLSQEPFMTVKKELDGVLAKSYSIKPTELMPWHYQDPFFQEAPAMGELDWDAYYKNYDVKQLASSYFAGIGMDVEPILANSDLYEKPGKNPHAFSTDIDREGDVRILCNLQNNERWMETTLHELGHAVYDRYHDAALPYLLRQPAHAFTTEGIAMFFGRFSRNADWMQAMLKLSEADYKKISSYAKTSMRAKQLVFARWAMVMYFFEKELYRQPDQDLNGLWWQLVQKYQGVNPPPDRQASDWAAKIHFTIAPCYYHNYLLGELFASQLYATVSKGVPVAAIGNTALGETLKKSVFSVGTRYRWNEMIKAATGEPLTAKYFVQQFVAQ
jgi:peptidyl-dipeptidase A